MKRKYIKVGKRTYSHYSVVRLIERHRQISQDPEEIILLFEGTHPDKKSQAPKIYGQELTPTTYAMAKMNAFLHDFIGADLRIGDTFRNPRFVADDSALKRFDYVIAKSRSLC